jgi:hypothetical protein
LKDAGIYGAKAMMSESTVIWVLLNHRTQAVRVSLLKVAGCCLNHVIGDGRWCGHAGLFDAQSP